MYLPARDTRYDENKNEDYEAISSINIRKDFDGSVWMDHFFFVFFLAFAKKYSFGGTFALLR